MPLHQLAEHPSSPKTRVRVSRVYFYTLVSLMLIWLGLIAGGVIAVKILVTLDKPEPSPSLSIAETPSAQAPEVATPNIEAPRGLARQPEAIGSASSETVPWRSLIVIALCCAFGSMMIAQRLNPPPRRSLSRSHSRKS